MYSLSVKLERKERRYMPTDRFLNLPEEKKDKIKNAIIQELLRVSYEDVSINQIIHTAGISRGSFYTYFQDKRDAYAYILHGIRCDMWKICRESLEESGGDFWIMLQEMLKGGVKYCEQYGYSRFLENTLTNPALARIFYGSLLPSEEIWNDICGRIDTGQFKQCLREELWILTRIGTELLTMLFNDYFNRSISLDEAVRSLDVRMNIIRYGVCA